MKRYSLLLLFLVVTLSSLNAQEVEEDTAHHTGIISSLSLGARYLSARHNRGVYFYRDFQIDPVIAPFFWDDRIEFLGDSLGIRDFVYDKILRLRTKVGRISDDALFPTQHKNFSKLNTSRPTTYEWTTSAEIFLPRYDNSYLAEIDLNYSKDVSIHHGNYFELLGKLKLGDLHAIFNGPYIEPNLIVSVGAGDHRHNEYFYGKGAGNFGLNNLYYGLWFAFPHTADRYYPVVEILGFTTLGYDNRHAPLAAGNNQGIIFSLIATVDVLNM